MLINNRRTISKGWLISALMFLSNSPLLLLTGPFVDLMIEFLTWTVRATRLAVEIAEDTEVEPKLRSSLRGRGEPFLTWAEVDNKKGEEGNLRTKLLEVLGVEVEAEEELEVRLEVVPRTCKVQILNNTRTLTFDLHNEQPPILFCLNNCWIVLTTVYCYM